MKNEVVSELMDLYVQGLILWPLGALWGRSPLGEVNEQRFARSVAEHDPGLYDIRDDIAGTDQFKDSGWSAKEQKARSFVFWKFVAVLHFAGEKINGVDEVQEVHLLKLAEALPRERQLETVGAVDDEEEPALHGRNFLGRMRKDPLFAIAVRRDLEAVEGHRLIVRHSGARAAP